MNLFEIEFEGAWDRELMLIDWQPADYARQTDPALEPLIDQEWAQFLTRYPRAFPGLMARYAGFKIEGEQLRLLFGRTNYKEHIVLNTLHPELHSKGDAYLANGCAASLAVITSDHALPLGKRSLDVAEGAGLWHVVGGNLNFEEGQIPDPFGTAEKEALEELNLKRDELEGLRCLGLVRNAQTRKPDLVFTARTPLNRLELWDRLANAEDAYEHSEWQFIEATPPAITHFLDANLSAITPAGAGVLTLVARSLG